MDSVGGNDIGHGAAMNFVDEVKEESKDAILEDG